MFPHQKKHDTMAASSIPFVRNGKYIALVGACVFLLLLLSAIESPFFLVSCLLDFKGRLLLSLTQSPVFLLLFVEYKLCVEMTCVYQGLN